MMKGRKHERRWQCWLNKNKEKRKECQMCSFLPYFQQSTYCLSKEVLNCNNLVKYGVLTSDVLIPSYINQRDGRDGCQPAVLPQPNAIIRPGSSFLHGASLSQKPKSEAPHRRGARQFPRNLHFQRIYFSRCSQK